MAQPSCSGKVSLRSLHDMNGLDYVALRYFNAYGPRMDIHGRYTEVLIRWMERLALRRFAGGVRRRPANAGHGARQGHRAGERAGGGGARDRYRAEHRQRSGDQPAAAGPESLHHHGRRPPCGPSTRRSAP